MLNYIISKCQDKETFINDKWFIAYNLFLSSSSGKRGAGVDPTRHWVRGVVHTEQVTNSSHGRHVRQTNKRTYIHTYRKCNYTMSTMRISRQTQGEYVYSKKWKKKQQQGKGTFLD